ncbi:hypothetical protein [Minwuia thermotolerans]|uniref:hypothetical protein n=1 Tax=Minwuia thermotolerans TaxID=2056226 RepID=UPI000F640402|nr:hypothetical protein [Minwuia thermotolerans]
MEPSYTRLNEGLNEVLLGGRYEGRPLYMVLTPGEEEHLASILGVEQEQLSATAGRIVGNRLDDTGDPYTPFHADLRHWNVEGRREPPPFTGLLHVLAHAAEMMHSDGNFSSANYYQRLHELTGVERNRLSFHGRSTKAYWIALNRWLAENDFVYGRPTAQKLNSWEYVSYAMSQAVVRQADKELFYSMFERFRFSGSEDIDSDEMHSYVDEWMRGPKPTQRLRAAWAKKDLRRRVCQAAVEALSEWRYATIPEDSHARGKRLSAVASLSRGLSGARFFMAFGIPGELSTPVTGLRAKDNAGSAAGETLEIANRHYAAFATLCPDASVNIPRVLAEGIELSDEKGGSKYSRQRSLLVPLVQHEGGAYWLEVGRTQLGKRYLVMCSDGAPSLRESLEQFLRTYAAPGYKHYKPGEMEGLPTGWTLYENVEFVVSPPQVPTGLTALHPVATEATLSTTEGLRLGPDTWHSSMPPAIRLSGEAGMLDLVVYEEDQDGEDQVIVSSSGYGECALELGGIGLDPHSDLRVAGYRNGNRVVERPLLLRSARRPRPLRRDGTGTLYWQALSTATMADNGAQHLGVRGHIVEGLGSADPPGFGVASDGGLCFQGQQEEDTPLGITTADPALIRGTYLEQCKKGRHVFRNVDLEPGEKPTMACIVCEHRIPVPRSPGPPAPKPQSTVNRSSNPRVPVASPAVHIGEPLDMNLVLDALCYLDNGSWRQFEDIVSSESLQPWEARSLAEDLSALGFIDVELEGATNRVRRWSVVPPVLTFAPDGIAYFSGFRSEDLVEQAREALVTQGLTLEQLGAPGAPDVLCVQGLSPREAPSLLAGIEDPHGRPLAVVTDAAQRLGSAVLQVDGLSAAVRPAHVGATRNVARFDTSTCRWIPVDELGGVGAYRYDHAGREYCFRDNEGHDWVGPHEIVKLLASRASGSHLHGYNPSKQVFVSALGCEPVGLLRRLLVACSGTLPERKKGMASYSSVPPHVAGLVMHVLYESEILP